MRRLRDVGVEIFHVDGRPLPSRVVSAKVSLRQRLAEIWQSRELIAFLIRKELKVRYKNSVLGFVWSFLNPALILGVYYVVFKYFLPEPRPVVRDLSVRRAAPLEPVQQLADQLGRRARRPCRAS